MFWRKGLLAALLLLNAVLLYRLVWGEYGYFAYRELRSKYETLQGELETVESRSLELSAEIRRLKNDPQAQEKAVRDKLNFVRDNEILYIFPKDGEKAPGEGADEQQN